jgi:hypothetical protein
MQARYRLLDTTRPYAAEKLKSAGERWRCKDRGSHSPPHGAAERAVHLRYSNKGVQQHCACSPCRRAEATAKEITDQLPSWIAHCLLSTSYFFLVEYADALSNAQKVRRVTTPEVRRAHIVRIGVGRTGLLSPPMSTANLDVQRFVLHLSEVGG